MREPARRMRVTPRQVGMVTLALALLGAGFVSGVGVSGFPRSTDYAAAAPAQGPHTLQIIPAGPGTVKYTPAGGNPSNDCDTGASQIAQNNSAFSAFHCEQTYTANQTVTLQAIPSPTGPGDEGRVYSFVRWSADECAGQNPCRLVMPMGRSPSPRSSARRSSAWWCPTPTPATPASRRPRARPGKRLPAPRTRRPRAEAGTRWERRSRSPRTLDRASSTAGIATATERPENAWSSPPATAGPAPSSTTPAPPTYPTQS